MILDGVFQGVLDQEKGRLIVYDEPEKDVSIAFHSGNRLQADKRLLQSTYATGLDTIKQISEVVNGLSEKARRLT
jgi:hypothetical protein